MSDLGSRSGYDTDMFVVGGGPAGLAAAIAARAKGLSVVVADGARPPIDKACGEGLMPDGVDALRALGISTAGLDCFPFRGIRFLESGTSVEAIFPSGVGFGIRRTTLHRLLSDRAAEVGVSLLWGTRVTGVADDGVRLDSRVVRARWIVGADGYNSRVRQWTGLDRHARNTRRYGFRRHYPIAPWSDFMELYWSSGCQIYVTPVGSGEICVALISRDSSLRLEDALPRFRDLNERLGGDRGAIRERGAVSASLDLRSVFHGRFALVGDASGSVDAITGEGVSLAFQHATALAEAIEKNDLSCYEAEHRRIERRPALMSALMLSLDRNAWLRRRALSVLASEPEIFSQLLAMHVGRRSPSRFVAAGMIPLAWRMFKSLPA